MRFTRNAGPPGAEGRWSLRASRWAETPSPTERAAAISRSLLERYGVVLREAAGAEGLPGGFGYVYDVYRAMEEQGRLRRGYFVAGRGATQFALPGAEERLRMPKKTDEEEPTPVILAATDPANPWGSLLPWPATAGKPMRQPGARVVMLEGRLLAWLGRGAKTMTTFFGDEPEAEQDMRRLVRALIGLNRTLMFDTIDGTDAPQSRIAKVMYEHGFGRRQGQLVRIPSSDPSMGRRRLGAKPANDVGVSFDFARKRNAEPATQREPELEPEPDLGLAPTMEEEDGDEADALHALDDDDTSFDTDFSTFDEVDA
jgi:ATP-dependent Lhr-like helicase